MGEGEPEPSAQGSGKGARPSRHMGTKGALRGFDVRTDHLLIIHGSGRSQGRTLSVYARVRGVPGLLRGTWLRFHQRRATRLIHLIGIQIVDRLYANAPVPGRSFRNRPKAAGPALAHFHSLSLATIDPS